MTNSNSIPNFETNLVREINLTDINDQQKLNDLVVAKINRKIQYRQTTVQKVLEQLEHDGKLAKDFIVPIGSKVRNSIMPSTISFSANGSVKMSIKDYEQELHFNEHSLIQIGAKYGVPGSYLKSLNASEWGRELSANILNQHSENIDRERVLIRTVGETIRGVMSDQYRRLDSIKIVEMFVRAISKQGAQLCDAHINDTKLFLEAIIPTPIQIQTPKNGTVFIAFGVRLSNSDFGDGSLQLRSFILQGACLNGMVTESVLKQIHLGGRLPDDLALSQKTYELDTRTQASLVNDLTNGLMSTNTIKNRAQLIIDASEKDVDLNVEMKKLVKAGLQKGEVEQVQKVMMNGSINDGVQGAPTLWKLTQGITAVARDKEATRRRELEELAGELLIKK